MTVPDADTPLFRVVRGELDEAALAALTTVLLARAARRPAGSGSGPRRGPPAGDPTADRKGRLCPSPM